MFFLPEIASAWWASLIHDFADTQRREAMRLQLDVAGAEDNVRMCQRIEHIGPGARAFLDHLHWLTQITWLNPLFHHWTTIVLRRFAYNFRVLERELAHQAHLPPTDWRELHEERLIAVVATNDGYFGSVLALQELPRPVQAQLVQGIAHELERQQAPDSGESPAQQLG